MNKKCLFSYCHDDGDFSFGFVLDVPNGISNYPDLIKHYHEFFKSDVFSDYVKKEFTAISIEIVPAITAINVRYTTNYGEYDFYFFPNFVTGF